MQPDVPAKRAYEGSLHGMVRDVSDSPSTGEGPAFVTPVSRSGGDVSRPPSRRASRPVHALRHENGAASQPSRCLSTGGVQGGRSGLSLAAVLMSGKVILHPTLSLSSV